MLCSLRSGIGRQSTSRKASACVEFAVLAPFLVLLFLVTTDYSRIFYYQVALNQCARNGALFGANLRSYQETTWVSPYATGTPTDDNIKNVTIQDGANLSPALAASQVTVGHANGADGNAAVQVTITYTFSTVSSILGFGSTFTMTAKCSMRVAQ